MAQIVISSLPPLPNLTGSAVPKGTDLSPATDITDTTVNATGKTNKYTRADELNFVLTSLGLTTYTAALVATTVALTASYSNGTAGVGATLTNSGAIAALVIDGVSVAVGNRVLVKDQVSTAENGIYVVTVVGSDSINWVLTRATDFDTAEEVEQYGVVLVNQGSVNAGLVYQESAAGSFTIGTSPITFVAYSTVSSINSATSITGTANQIIASASTGDVTLSLPQDIATTSSVTFGQLNVDNIQISGNTIESTNAGGNITLVPDATGNVDIFTPPSSESSSISIDGFSYNTAFRINDVGGTSPAQMILHRHSTTLAPVFITARSNSNSDAHANVTNSMPLYSHYACGWTGSTYSIFGGLNFQVESTGTISNTSAPGNMTLATTKVNEILPTTALTINSSQVVTLANALPVGSGGTGVTSAPTNGQLLIGNGTGYALSTLTAGSGISIANGAGIITIAGTGSGIGWTEVTGTTQTIVADAGYVANNASLVTFTLPATAAFGTAINIIGKGAGGWAIAQLASQSIRFGSASTTVGVGGSLASTNAYDSITLICTTANLVWTMLSAPQGALTVV